MEHGLSLVCSRATPRPKMMSYNVAAPGNDASLHAEECTVQSDRRCELCRRALTGRRPERRLNEPGVPSAFDSKGPPTNGVDPTAIGRLQSPFARDANHSRRPRAQSIKRATPRPLSIRSRRLTPAAAAMASRPRHSPHGCQYADRRSHLGRANPHCQASGGKPLARHTRSWWGPMSVYRAHVLDFVQAGKGELRTRTRRRGTQPRGAWLCGEWRADCQLSA